LTDPNIDQEFRDLIFQDDLTDEEKRELETDILVRGCVVPLIVWNGLLVDGHHRYEICKKHNIPFDVKEIEFENREYAKAWILTNQLARRNLTPYRKIELLKRRDDFLKMAEEGKRKKQISAEITNNKRWETPIEESLLSTVDKSDKNEQSKPKEKINVRDAMAKELNVSHGTIARAGIIMQKVAEGVVPPETIEKLRKGDETIGRVYKIIKTKENFEEKKKNLEEQIEHLIPSFTECLCEVFSVLAVCMHPIS